MFDRTAEELLSQCSVLIFDFDGVILDSNKIKEEGFRRIFVQYGHDKAEKIVEFHRANGGMSRYEKINYFFRDITNEPIEQKTLEAFAAEFSKVTMALLKDPGIQIRDTIDYIASIKDSKDIYVASAADEEDLSELCGFHEIDGLFDGIYGSPRQKADIVADILRGRVKERCVLIGDSVNDLKAAQANHIAFIGYNNAEFKNKLPYVERFADLTNCSS